jgi:hypothetical protein
MIKLPLLYYYTRKDRFVTRGRMKIGATESVSRLFVGDLGFARNTGRITNMNAWTSGNGGLSVLLLEIGHNVI